MLVAHRGGGRLAPENTMVAFRSAIDDWGADMLELDVRLSKDGVRTSCKVTKIFEYTATANEDFAEGGANRPIGRSPVNNS